MVILYQSVNGNFGCFMSFGILFRAYIESDLVGKAIFFLLFLLSIITWIVLLYKAKAFIAAKKEAKLYQEWTGKEQLPLEKRGPFSRLLLAIQTQSSHILNKNPLQTFSKTDLEILETFATLTSQKEIKNLSKHLFILQAMTSLAPFVGILGTVWGILVSLFEMRYHSASLTNSAIIAGLSTALATTVIGLLIAIPSLIAYTVFKNSQKNLYGEMQDLSHALLLKLREDHHDDILSR